MKSWIALFFLVASFPASASSVFDPDCDNYCAFQDKPDNCQGIRFRDQKNNSYSYAYSLGEVGVCIDTYGNHISLAEIKNKCDCKNAPHVEGDLTVDMTLPMKDTSKTELIALKKSIQSWTMCAPDPSTIKSADPLHPFKGSDLESCEKMKSEGKEGYIVLADCDQFDDSKCGYYGNTNNIAGPYCLAGDEDRCRDIKKNQDPVTGAWYRNAYQLRFPETERGQPLFSRDEVLGIMLYFVKTKDKEAALKWLGFLAKNKKNSSLLGKLVSVPNICPAHAATKPSDIDDQTWANMQADDRCEMRPDSWGQFYLVLKFIGVTDDEIKDISESLYYNMWANYHLVDSINLVSASTVPAKGPGSYQLALQATASLLLHAIGASDNADLLNQTAKIVDDRSEHTSPYYRYLALGMKSSEYGAQLIKRFCPTNRPSYGQKPDGAYSAAGDYFDSGVQYFGGKDAYHSKDESAGYDCIAWINFYLNS